MVQMLARGGDVFDRLTARTKYSERDARDLAVTLVQTMYEIHKKTIVHRDLKPENLLLKEAENDTGILVADFGFAKHCRKGDKLKTRCGTPAFVAPEIVLWNPYNEQCDMWSVGCIMAEMLTGKTLFPGTDRKYKKRTCFHFLGVKFHQPRYRSAHENNGGRGHARRKAT